MAPYTALTVAMSERCLAAAGRGDTNAVAAWLEEGGGVDAHCAVPELEGMTLLMGAAASGGQEAMVWMLLQRGASVNLQDSLGATALMHAAAHGHTTIAQALLDAEADASLQSKSGSTALMFAEQEKNTETAQLLRQHTKRQTAAAEAAVMHAAATAPTPKGRHVRIFGLKPTPNAVPNPNPNPSPNSDPNPPNPNPLTP